MDGLARRMQRISGDAGRLLFVDAEGRPVPGVGGPPPAADWRWPDAGSADWRDDIAGDGGPWVAAAAPIPALGWRALSLQPRRDAYAEESAGAARAAAFFAGVCALVAGGAYLLSLRLLRPVELLLAAAVRVSANDFSRPVPVLGWGEFERLRETFNAMAEKIRRYQNVQIEKIMEEKAKIDALVKNIPAGVMLAGHDGRILYINSIAARILHAPGPERAARDSDIVKSPQLMKLIESVRAGARNVEGAVVEMQSTEGEKQSTYSCQALIVTRETTPIGVLVLMRDVTVERELARMKEEFFHAIIHDLRGPLTVIDGIVTFMKKQPSAGGREARYAELADQASKRLGSLVSNILDIAKIESGTMKVVVVKAQADAMLQAVRKLYEVPGEAKRIAIAALPAPGLELNCDQPLLERVLMNLVGNALKFTPEGGRIELAARLDGPDVEFSVQDTGPGIPPDKLDAVFEKFKQLDRDTAARAGYGLGLSICRKIVEMHHGRIWVESAPGKGSRFAFRVPSAGAAPRAEPVSSRA